MSNPGHDHTSVDLVTGKTRLNPGNTCTDGVTVHVVSRSSGKPTVAHAANVMANDPKWKQQRIDVQDMNAILEGMFGWSHIRQIYLVFYR